jgi:hypothetical protein
VATNFFFNNFSSSQEQRLIESLIIESIKIYGQDMYYITRAEGQVDDLLNEDPTRSYNRAIPCEFYIKNVEGFGGQGDFLSKFNLEIRDQITLTVARRVFDEEIATITEQPRPFEGDLIYFPLNGKIFEIKFVEHEAIFYQLGSLQTYDLKCELFEYSNERMTTGIDVVDQLYEKYSTDNAMDSLLTEDGYKLMTETGDFLSLETADSLHVDPFADNDTIQTESNGFIDFTEHDPFSEGGTF